MNQEVRYLALNQGNMERYHDPLHKQGLVAQLGEQLLCKQKVVGSIPTVVHQYENSLQSDSVMAAL